MRYIEKKLYFCNRNKKETFYGNNNNEQSMVFHRDKLLEPMQRVDPYQFSPSGDSFFADPRNVKAVENDIEAAHCPDATFTRLETREDVMSMIEAL